MPDSNIKVVALCNYGLYYNGPANFVFSYKKIERKLTIHNILNLLQDTNSSIKLSIYDNLRIAVISCAKLSLRPMENTVTMVTDQKSYTQYY